MATSLIVTTKLKIQSIKAAMTAKNKGTIIPCGPDMMKGHYKAIKFILEKGAGNTVQFTHQ